MIPREKKLVRLYVQLNEVSSNGQHVDRSKITPEIILKSAQKIMSPYKLTYDYCDWWTAYQVHISSRHTTGANEITTDWPACRQSL